MRGKKVILTSRKHIYIIHPSPETIPGWSSLICFGLFSKINIRVLTLKRWRVNLFVYIWKMWKKEASFVRSAHCQAFVLLHTHTHTP